MDVTYNWIISSMEEYPKTSDDLIDVVFIVHWRRQASTTVDGKFYLVDTYGALPVSQPDPEDFTPYEELTFEQVCGWLEAGMDVEAVDANLLVLLENQINPPVVSLPLPWNTTTTTTTEIPVYTTSTTTTNI